MIVPTGRGEARFKEQRSEFVGLLFPLDAVDEFQPCLKALKSEYPTARHICWAYRIYVNAEIVENSSDAGEPGGTAGLPILNQIRKKEAVNSAVFVIRYFGGIKLGKRGLIDAYGKAAADVIQSVAFKEWTPTAVMTIKANLKYYGEILQVISKFKGRILNDFSDHALKLEIELPESQEEGLRKNLTGGLFGQMIMERSEREPNQGGY